MASRFCPEVAAAVRLRLGSASFDTADYDSGTEPPFEYSDHCPTSHLDTAVFFYCLTNDLGLARWIG